MVTITTWLKAQSTSSEARSLPSNNGSWIPMTEETFGNRRGAVARRHHRRGLTASTRPTNSYGRRACRQRRHVHRLLTPYGLVARGRTRPPQDKDGHPKLRPNSGETRTSASSATFGIRLDVTLDDLRRHYHQVLFCTGAQPIGAWHPGEDSSAATRQRVCRLVQRPPDYCEPNSTSPRTPWPSWCRQRRIDVARSFASRMK